MVALFAGGYERNSSYMWALAQVARRAGQACTLKPERVERPAGEIARLLMITNRQ